MLSPWRYGSEVEDEVVARTLFLGGDLNTEAQSHLIKNYTGFDPEKLKNEADRLSMLGGRLVSLMQEKNVGMV